LSRKHTLTSLILENKTALALGLTALSIVDAAQLTIPLVIQKAVDALASPRGGSPTKYALVLIAIGSLMAVFRFIWRWFLLGAARRVEQKLRNDFFAHLGLMSLDFFKERKPGDIMAHTVNDIEAVRMACGLGLVIAYDGILLLVFILSAMLYISPSLTLYAAIPFPVLGIVIYRFGRSIEKRFERVQESFSELTEKARETLSGIKIVKAYVREDDERRQFAEKSKDYLYKNLALARLSSIYQPLIVFLAGTAGAIFLLLGGRSAIMMEISLGDFAAVLVYLGMLSWPMMALGWAVDIVKRGNASLNRINEILALPPEEKDIPGALDIEIKGDITVRNLSYSYPEGNLALDGVSLNIEEGEAFGITGATGSGKTTLLKLILRVIEPDFDTIFLNGSFDIRKIKISCLRKGIVFVPQEAFIFSGSIRDNIAFMNKDITDGEIVEAARIAQIYEDVMGFKDGFDTLIGERGLTISGGQRQRLALARALVMKPRILVLDDVLSSLDLKTESEVLRNLRRTMRGRTLIVVSSRVPSISGFDRIAVLDEGKVVELGSHEELIEQDGIYASLYSVQAAA
jgi:ATP-binding cassette subfamily B protein